MRDLWGLFKHLRKVLNPQQSKLLLLFGLRFLNPFIILC